MKNSDCKIVRDLLPTYIDKLTSKETNEFIERHLKECNECKRIYEKMCKKIGDSNRKVIHINGFKKVNKKIKFLEKTIIFLLVITMLAIGYMQFYKKGIEDYEKGINSMSEQLGVKDDYTAYYATIKDFIYDNGNVKQIRVKGIEDNEEQWRGESIVDVNEDCEILWNREKVSSDKLKTGQNVIVYKCDKLEGTVRQRNISKKKLTKIIIVDDEL